MQPFIRTTWTPLTDEQIEKLVKDVKGQFTREEVLESLNNAVDESECYANDKYTVAIRRNDGPAGEMIHLSIRRNDREAIHDWRDMQEIKNMLVSPEAEAIELYPAESRKVDSANQYHLWVFPVGIILPIGFHERFVGEPKYAENVKQRPFDEGK